MRRPGAGRGPARRRSRCRGPTAPAPDRDRRRPVRPRGVRGAGGIGLEHGVGDDRHRQAGVDRGGRGLRRRFGGVGRLGRRRGLAGRRQRPGVDARDQLEGLRRHDEGLDRGRRAERVPWRGPPRGPSRPVPPPLRSRRGHRGVDRRVARCGAAAVRPGARFAPDGRSGRHGGLLGRRGTVVDVVAGVAAAVAVRVVLARVGDGGAVVQPVLDAVGVGVGGRLADVPNAVAVAVGLVRVVDIGAIVDDVRGEVAVAVIRDLGRGDVLPLVPPVPVLPVPRTGGRRPGDQADDEEQGNQREQRARRAVPYHRPPPSSAVVALRVRRWRCGRPPARRTWVRRGRGGAWIVPQPDPRGNTRATRAGARRRRGIGRSREVTLENDLNGGAPRFASIRRPSHRSFARKWLADPRGAPGSAVTLGDRRREPRM